MFRLGLDLARMVFLLSLHAGEFTAALVLQPTERNVATAVMFTIYGDKFSCAIFSEYLACFLGQIIN